MKFKKTLFSKDGHIITLLAGERLSDPANVRVPTAVVVAAPELLEACERLANAKSLGEKNEARRLARAAIAKAKGTL